MTFQNERLLDAVGWRILHELQQDARLSYNELGRRVGLSAPATAERVRRLEDAGIIAGYSARIDLPSIGVPITAFIHLRCAAGRCLLQTGRMQAFPEIREVHKLSSRHCTMLRVAVSSLRHLEDLTDRLGRHGELETTVVLSSPLPLRDVDSSVRPGSYPDASTHRWDDRR